MIGDCDPFHQGRKQDKRKMPDYEVMKIKSMKGKDTVIAKVNAEKESLQREVEQLKKQVKQSRMHLVYA